MNQLDAEQVKRSVDIVKLIEQSGTKLKASGEDGFVGLCPFHKDKNPSLSVTPSKGLYFCFGCEASGDVITFVQRKEGVDFPEALRRVADSAGMTVPAPIPHPGPVNGKPANGTQRQTIQPTAVAPQPGDQKPGRVVATYPYTDEGGVLLFEVLRLEPKSFRQRRPDPASPDGWLWKLGDVRRVLYRLPEVIKAGEVFVVEGEKDADALVRLGLIATTNAGGANQKWQPDWTEVLAGKRVVVIPDNDAPGLKRGESIIRDVKGRAAEALLVRVPSPYRDISDFLRDGHTRQDVEELVTESRHHARRERLRAKGLLGAREIVELIDGGLSGFMRPQKGLFTGFTKFDRLTLGLHAGELSILAARPSMGKTALALNIAHHVARQNRTVAIFSYEMGRQALLTRLVCSRAGVNSLRLREGVLTGEERRRINQAFTEIADLPILIDDSSLDLQGLEKRIARLQQEGSVDLVFVDYLQLVRSQRSESRNREVGDLARGFKLLAGQFECPFLVLSQLSRATETRTGNQRPQLSDLRDSGEIENHADLVAFVFREEVYKPNKEELKGQAELIISKQRNGPTGRCELRFEAPFMRFSDPVEVG